MIFLRMCSRDFQHKALLCHKFPISPEQFPGSRADAEFSKSPGDCSASAQLGINHNQSLGATIHYGLLRTVDVRYARHLQLDSL